MVKTHPQFQAVKCGFARHFNMPQLTVLWEINHSIEKKIEYVIPFDAAFKVYESFIKNIYVNNNSWFCVNSSGAKMI